MVHAGSFGFLTSLVPADKYTAFKRPTFCRRSFLRHFQQTVLKKEYPNESKNI
jgi:hypothetical protein